MRRCLERTEWLKDYKGKVRGNLEAALQSRGRAVAVCIEGGPISQIESSIMRDLCEKVKVYGRDDLLMESDRDVERYVFSDFQARWARQLRLDSQ